MKLILAIVLCLGVSWAEPCPGQQQCVNGQCFPSRSGGIGVAVGGWRSVEAAATYPSVVPVYFGNDPTPAAGVYVGVIGGRGVTLTCWHAAKHGVRRVASAAVSGVTRDQYGYDLAAVWTEPLSVPPAKFGEAPKPGDRITITGLPGGRVVAKVGRVLGYFLPEGGRQWGELSMDVACRDGDSGGAVVCRGLFVGLLWGTRSDGSARSVAVSIPAIVDFLRRLRACHPITPEPEDWEGLDRPGCDLSAIKEELSELRKLIAAIPAGRDGEDGEDGLDGVSPEIGYEELAAKVVTLLKPIYVRRLDVDTGEEKVEQIHLGQGFTILNSPPE